MKADLRLVGLAVAFALGLGVLAAVPVEADGPFQFFAVTPCRLLDTRQVAHAPVLTSGVTRNVLVQTRCGIPTGAKAAALNVTITQPSQAGHLIFWPSGGAAPGVSTINFVTGEPALANGAIVPLSNNLSGDLSVKPFVWNSGTVHLILDVTGYFM
jgi:hypothetical protein